MALGGGIWAVQNKVLPGTYVNFSSVAKASAALSDRGYAAMPLVLDWGPDNEVFTVTNGDFQKNSLKLFGYAYADAAMLPLRELFKYTQTLYAYRLNSGGVKAENAFCSARYAGVAGNKLSTVITVNVDNDSLFDVHTYYGTTLIDTQVVSVADELVANDFVIFKGSATLEETAKTPLAGGTNGELTSAAYQTFLDKIESYSFNTLGCPSADATTIDLFVNFTKRMRDEIGAKFQTVIYNAYGNANVADYEGVIEVGNKIIGYDTVVSGFGEFGLVYWMTGVSAGCAVNKSNTNKRYDGECTVNVDYTQVELEKAIKAGRLMFHNVNGEVRILEDINSMVTVSDTKGDVFKSNQTIRVCDQIANDVAVLFNTRYLGNVPNDASGRIALWNDICKLLEELDSIRAIEDFDPEIVTVEQGDTKKAVVCTVSNLNIVNAMAQLYMSVIVM
ncbi:MAG: phage tail sheath family protein [Clostridia bacterium]|nr:phage tail sheath family protein [Clostridia bacterium]